MSWLTADQIREKFNIQTNAHGSQIESAITSAALIIQRSVASEIYDEASGDTVPTDSALLLRYSSVVESHAYLSMWFLIGNVGVKLTGDGFVKKAQDAGSVAMSGSIFTNEYLTPKDLETMKDGYLDNAHLYMGTYGTIIIGTTEEVVTAEQDLAMSSLQWF